MDMMQAFRIHHFGGPEVLQRESIEIPQPGPGEVLVRVAAASVNPVDYKTRSGRYPLVREDRLPYTLGRDFAGVVQAGDGTAEAGGQDDGTLQPGAAVYAFIGQEQGAFAEYVVIPGEALAHKPASLDFPTAAAVPLAGLTAWQGLFDHGGLQAGQEVLIHARGGWRGPLCSAVCQGQGCQGVRHRRG
jgi:NADPH:quinone reductase-like Zn-dependent oxidoreductase